MKLRHGDSEERDGLGNKYHRTAAGRQDFSGGLAPSWSKLDSEKNLTSAKPTGRDKGDERLQENSSAWRR